MESMEMARPTERVSADVDTERQLRRAKCDETKMNANNKNRNLIKNENKIIPL